MKLDSEFHAVHRTLRTTAKVKQRLREFEDAEHVALVYTPGERPPDVGETVSTSRPYREVADPIDVKVVEVIYAAPIMGPGGHHPMQANLVIASILPPALPRSYPDVTTNPVDPPTVSGTDISRDVG